MNVLVAGLVYGNRPLDIISKNLSISMAGHPYCYTAINKEGISNAMNEGLYIALRGGYDAIAYLANDIEEPKDWLFKKLEALKTYPKAGIIASSLDYIRTAINSEHIISNWLIDINLIKKIGIFNDEFFPYGPIDLDYCERANIAGYNTYYAMDCLAQHKGDHSVGNEYGYDKQALVQKNWAQHEADVKAYRQGTKSITIWKQESQ